MHALSLKAKNIRCVICDLDGVLTDGQVYLDNAQHELKSFYIQDGFGLSLLLHAGIEVAVITGSKNPLIETRMQQLKIRHYFTGQKNKQTAYDQLKGMLKMTDDECAYIGDDLPDLFIMQQVGLSVAVANAVDAVKHVADWTTQHKGGHGAVREVCDLLLMSQKKLDAALACYFAS